MLLQSSPNCSQPLSKLCSRDLQAIFIHSFVEYFRLRQHLNYEFMIASSYFDTLIWSNQTGIVVISSPNAPPLMQGVASPKCPLKCANNSHFIPPHTAPAQIQTFVCSSSIIDRNVSPVPPKTIGIITICPQDIDSPI